MTENEFKNAFVGYLFAREPGLTLWLNRYPIESNEPANPTRSAIIGGWFDTLKNVGLDDAKAAVRDIAAGDVERPSGFGEYPAVIRKAAKSHSNERFVADRKRLEGGSEREPRYRCPHCLDSSIVWFWSTDAIAIAEYDPKTFLAGRYRMPQGKAEAFACRCVCSGGRGFDPDRNFICDGKTKLGREALLSKLAENDVPTTQGQWEF